ncbi:DUF4158 domain-containing protein [Streptomyces ardesiacus]
MPVEFLSDEQAQAYGTFAEEPTRPELERFFFLDDVDQDLIALRERSITGSDSHSRCARFGTSACSWRTRSLCRGR